MSEWNADQYVSNGEFDKRAAMAQIKKLAEYGCMGNDMDIMFGQIIRVAQYARDHCSHEDTRA